MSSLGDQRMSPFSTNSKSEDKEETKVLNINTRVSGQLKHRVKLDYGYKALLRGIRQCLKSRMESSPMFTGRHHWTNEKLFKVTKVFIQKEFGLKNPSDYETWVLVLLLNPVKGILQCKKQTLYQMPACEELYNTLKDEGLEIFRDIFSNNNRILINKFFTNSIIRKLWPFVQKHLSY